MYKYGDVYCRLGFDTAVITFIKRDATIRNMLCTRNLSTVSLVHGFQGYELGAHDKKCNINNGNLAVFDLALGEARAFNIERVVNIVYCGVIANKVQYDALYEQFKQFCIEYDKSYAQSISLDDFESGTYEERKKYVNDFFEARRNRWK